MDVIQISKITELPDRLLRGYAAHSLEDALESYQRSKYPPAERVYQWGSLWYFDTDPTPGPSPSASGLRGEQSEVRNE